MSTLNIQDFIESIKKVLPKVYYLTSPIAEKGVLFLCQPNMVCNHQLWILNIDDLPIFKKHVEDTGAVPIDQREVWKQEQVNFNKMMTDNAEKFRKMYPVS